MTRNVRAEGAPGDKHVPYTYLKQLLTLYVLLVVGYDRLVDISALFYFIPLSSQNEYEMFRKTFLFEI